MGMVQLILNCFLAADMRSLKRSFGICFPATKKGLYMQIYQFHLCRGVFKHNQPPMEEMVFDFDKSRMRSGVYAL